MSLSEPVSPRLAVVIMAAGKGTRMKNPEVAKVMHPVNGKPMIEHVVDLAVRLRSDRIIVVVGWQGASVRNHLATAGKPVVSVEQSPQLGTGHAVMQAEPALAGFSGDVLVLSGDVPLLTYGSTDALIRHHRATKAVGTVLTAILPDPTGYGRILRHEDGSVRGIVEEKDAAPDQKAIREINSGIYVFRCRELFEGLRNITPLNAQGEYYLTDVFAHFWKNNLTVSALPAGDVREVMGINTVAQLEEIRQVMSSSSGKG